MLASLQQEDLVSHAPSELAFSNTGAMTCRLLLQKKIHRLPVVDENGSLVGVLSRGNLIKAALAMRKEAAAAVAAS